jgi:hypothetical protein
LNSTTEIFPAQCPAVTSLPFEMIQAVQPLVRRPTAASLEGTRSSEPQMLVVEIAGWPASSWSTPMPMPRSG